MEKMKKKKEVLGLLSYLLLEVLKLGLSPKFWLSEDGLKSLKLRESVHAGCDLGS